MAKILYMVKSATTCFGYMLFEIEVLIKCFSEIQCWMAAWLVWYFDSRYVLGGKRSRLVCCIGV